MQRLKLLRKEMGLSQKQLAQMFDVAQNTISQYENSARQPDSDLLIKFANFFGVDIDYLLELSDYIGISYERLHKIATRKNISLSKLQSTSSLGATGLEKCRRGIRKMPAEIFRNSVMELENSFGYKEDANMNTVDEGEIDRLNDLEMLDDLDKVFREVDDHKRREILTFAQYISGTPMKSSTEIENNTRVHIPNWRPTCAGKGATVSTAMELPFAYIPVTEVIDGTSYIIPLQGNSMFPLYQDGDILCCHLQRTLEDGEIGIFQIDPDKNGEGLGVCKKRVGDILVSLNPDYAGENIRIDEHDVRFHGKVLGKIKNKELIEYEQ
jgi:transcriptional regulator with XRE-family HTH domain